MNKILIFVVCFIFGLLLVGNFYIWKPVELVQTQALPTPTMVKKLDAKALLDTPPSLSVMGEVTNMSGEVLWESRAANDFSEITQPQPIQQGEALATGEIGSVEISFGEGISILISNESEVRFVQTLKDQFVLGHSKGNATYINKTTTPVSVRSSSLIILLTDGEMEIMRDNEELTISVEITEGTGEIAYNNAEFISQIVNLEQGDTFMFNIEERDGEVQ